MRQFVLPLALWTLVFSSCTGSDSSSLAADASVTDAYSQDANDDGSGGRATDASSHRGGSGGDSGQIDAGPAAVSHDYPQDDTLFTNPERGFYSAVDLLDEDDLSWVRKRGNTLVYSYVRLDDYRDAPLAKSLLERMDKGFETVRRAGLKLILRFSYNFGPYPNSEPDASKQRILQHIQQLRPHLRANRDVILLVQAGFIGAWGEWHTSTHHLLDDPADRKQILEALLDALPPGRMTQIRYPGYKFAMYGEALDPSHAFDGSNKARVGHHNDCFLADETDEGTYDDRPGVPHKSVGEWKEYLAADTRYVPMGGETCAVSSRSKCPTALREMKMLHFTFINADYHPKVVKSWAPCRPEMEKHLGYRFQLTKAAFPEKVRPGDMFSLSFELRNEGWARIFNERPVFVVFRGPQRYALELSVDVRKWGAGKTVHESMRLQLPPSMQPGQYDVALWLPDEAPALRTRPAYSVRIAGAQWNPRTGENVIGKARVVR